MLPSILALKVKGYCQIRPLLFNLENQLRHVATKKLHRNPTSSFQVICKYSFIHNISKAFDKVSHHGLLIKLMRHNLPVNFLEISERWLSMCYSVIKCNYVFSCV